MIVDPTDKTKAIDPETGRMAAEIYIVNLDNPAAPTMNEIRGGKFLCHGRWADEW